MTDLSPAAQAMFDAVRVDWEEWPVKEQQWRIACVLRATADQVVPYRHAREDETIREWRKVQEVRERLLAIAAELDPQ